MPLLDETTLLDQIEQLVLKSNGGSSYLDALVHYAELKGIDLEVLAEVIKRYPNLVMRLQADAEALRFLRPTTRLPI
jgi:hypothetical protein